MSGTYRYEIVEFENCLRAGYIDSTIEADGRFAPRLIANSRAAATDLLSVIKSQLKNCVSFDFSVAFITSGGIQVLIESLNELRCRNIQGRILTSTYLNFNDPSALRKLLDYENIETRVFQGNMHSKGYFFNKEGLSTVIVGSSNLTQTALTCNKEWNVLFHSFSDGEMLQTAKAEFEVLWTDESTVELTHEWLAQYEEFSKKENGVAKNRQIAFSVTGDTARIDGASKITPNKMQQKALESLNVLHSRNEKRALLISATGTGKTYLSALDVANHHPKKVLFLAHRKRILDASLSSFQNVLGDSYSYSVYGTGSPKPDETCIFAMITTISKHLEDFDSREFDYIIIDEAHRAGASGYQAAIKHFKPKFLLGMTATPSRTDGYDIYNLFNNVIAYRITLQDALENDMLTPFHYFGIADLEVDDEAIEDVSQFSRLTSMERAKHIMSKIEDYSVCREGRKGLVFCNRNNEAAKLSQIFNEHGYRTISLSGADGDEARDKAISALESGSIEYIFTVDIFNEGIDIPSVNQVVMLRRTESAIVFIQQLGRGLRKASGKDYTLVLDFIGNYQQNYLVPIALSGDRTYNKDNLRRFVKEGSSVIPGCSTISFDQISEAQIFHAIDEGRFSETKLIRGEYDHLKQMLGRIPSLIDFDENESIDPLLIFKKFGSYTAFLMKYEPSFDVPFNKRELDMLKFISQKIANGKRVEELALLDAVARKKEEPASEKPSSARRDAAVSALRVLSGEFSSSPELSLIERNNETYLPSKQFELALEKETFYQQVRDLVEFGLSRNASLYSETYKDTAFSLYAKYTYEEVCRLLNWDRNVNGQNIGGYKFDATTNTFPVFINYDKDPNISDTIKYEDRFISDRELIAISKQPRYLDSPEIERLRTQSENGMKIYLFVRKNKDDKDGGKEFYFLGEMHPAPGEPFKPITMSGTTASAVEITYKLETPVRADIFDYLTSDFGDLSKQS